MSFDVGGNRSTRRKPTQTRGEHANSTQKGRDSNPGPSCCEATPLTTAPPCCPSTRYCYRPPPPPHPFPLRVLPQDEIEIFH